MAGVTIAEYSTSLPKNPVVPFGPVRIVTFVWPGGPQCDDGLTWGGDGVAVGDGVVTGVTGVPVGVADGVLVAVGVAVGRGVFVGRGVTVGTGVFVARGVTIGDGEGVSVGIGVMGPWSGGYTGEQVGFKMPFWAVTVIGTFDTGMWVTYRVPFWHVHMLPLGKPATDASIPRFGSIAQSAGDLIATRPNARICTRQG